jgi:hypothetical protein
VSHNLVTDISSVGSLLLTDICDLLSLATNSPIYDTGVIVVGRITNVANKTVTFYRGVSGVTPIVVTDTTGIQIVVPVHSTFINLPSDVFRTEFIDSYVLAYPWNKEDFSSLCHGETVQFPALVYAPVVNSLSIVKNSQTLFEGVSNDYSINYVNSVITFTEPPLAGDILFVKYQYVTGT